MFPLITVFCGFSGSGVPMWIQRVYDVLGTEHIINASDLQLDDGPQLGKGNFGRVMKGQLCQDSNTIPVAIKSTDFQGREDILKEANLML